MRRRWLTAIGIALGVLAIIGWMAVGPLLSPHFERHVRETLATYFGGQAELRGIQVSIFPSPRVTGEGFALRHRGRTDVPPLVQIERFAASASWSGLLRRPRRVEVVRLEGLRIHIPPRRPGEKRLPDVTGSDKDPDVPPPAPARGDEPGRPETPVIIDRMETPGARLEIAPRDPAKPVKLFDIHTLALGSVATDRPMRFTATLTNPKPPGAIEASGEFGPFDREEPSGTPLGGRYVFERADLGVFKGIAGILSSKGTFKGVLERIEVDGQTSTPDFQVTVAGHRVPLETTFSAVVDGTNGNTFLVPVKGSFLQTSLTARGGVFQRAKGTGREISLDVAIDKARIEDLLKLAMKGKSIMTGAAVVATKLRIPPGEEDVIDKLELDGEFRIASATFTDLDVQRTIAKLSARSRGPGGCGERRVGRLGFRRPLHAAEGPPRLLAADLLDSRRLGQPAGRLRPAGRRAAVPGNPSAAGPGVADRHRLQVGAVAARRSAVPEERRGSRDPDQDRGAAQEAEIRARRREDGPWTIRRLVYAASAPWCCSIVL